MHDLIDHLYNLEDPSNPHTFSSYEFTDLFSFSGRFLPVSSYISLNVKAAQQLSFGKGLEVPPDAKVQYTGLRKRLRIGDTTVYSGQSNTL